MTILCSKDGIPVEVTNAFWQHATRHPEINIGIVTEALSLLDLKMESGDLQITLTFNRIIGQSALLIRPKPVGLDDLIWFGKRGNKKEPSPVAKGKPGFDTCYLLVRLSKSNNGCWILRSAYAIGDIAAKPEPTSGMIKSDDEVKDSLRFWKSHYFAEEACGICGELIQSTWREVMTNYNNQIY